MERTKKAWINGLIFIVTLGINAMGAIGLINGLSQKEISDKYLTLITPSPATFSIWSVIYTLLLISVITMIVKQDDPYYQKAVDEISGLFRLSSIFNILWIVSFSFLLVEISVVFILGFVITLSMISLKLLKIQDKRRWLLPAAFGMYAGWLFIATVVNISAMLVKIQWNGFGIPPEIWGVIMLSIAVVLISLVLLRIKNAILPLPAAWAYLGINQFLNSPVGFNGQYKLLQTTALVGMAVLIGVAAIALYRNRFSLLPYETGQAGDLEKSDRITG